MYLQIRRAQFHFLYLITCASIVLMPRLATARSSVEGALDAVDQNGIASGWAQDSSTPPQAIQVHVYVDGPAGSGGTFVPTVPANVPRPDAGSGGFRFPIPSKYWDGSPHALYV